MEDPQEDPLAVHCYCVYVVGMHCWDVLGVSRSVECDLLSVLSCPRFFCSIYYIVSSFNRDMSYYIYIIIVFCMYVVLV